MGIKITELPQITTPKSTDEFPTSQDNGLNDSSRTTYKISLGQLQTYINAAPNTRIDQLESSVGSFNSFDSNLLNKYLPLSGGMMTGNIDLSGKQINRFSAKIVEVTDSVTLNETHNGCILLVNKNGLVTPDDRVNVQVPLNLGIGFNVLVIQIGEIQVKITKADNSITLANPDDALSTRQKYSQINLAVIKQNLIWITGDMV